MTACTTKSRQKRLDSYALARPKWTKIRETLGVNACGTLKIHGLAPDATVRVENPHQNGRTDHNIKLLGKFRLMSSFFHFSICALGAFLIAPNTVAAAPSGNQVCKKMISDGRGGELSQDDCLCMYRVADTVLDEDIKSLLFDAWYSGNNNMQTMVLLPKPKRVKKQFRKMQRSLKANCE